MEELSVTLPRLLPTTLQTFDWRCTIELGSRFSKYKPSDNTPEPIKLELREILTSLFTKTNVKPHLSKTETKIKFLLIEGT